MMMLHHHVPYWQGSFADEYVEDVDDAADVDDVDAADAADAANDGPAADDECDGD